VQNNETRTFPPRHWIISSYCGPNGGNCVQVNQAFPGTIGVRDSKNPDGGVLVIGRARWRAFLAEVREGGLAA
jgi:hypothetical protein